MWRVRCGSPATPCSGKRIVRVARSPRADERRGRDGDLPTLHPGPHRDACTALMTALRSRSGLQHHVQHSPVRRHCAARDRVGCAPCAVRGCPARRCNGPATISTVSVTMLSELRKGRTHTYGVSSGSYSYAARSSLKRQPERTRTRIPRRASPHPTIEHTSVNHTPKEKGMEGNEGRSRAYSA